MIDFVVIARRKWGVKVKLFVVVERAGFEVEVYSWRGGWGVGVGV